MTINTLRFQIVLLTIIQLKDSIMEAVVYGFMAVSLVFFQARVLVLAIMKIHYVKDYKVVFLDQKGIGQIYPYVVLIYLFMPEKSGSINLLSLFLFC